MRDDRGRRGYESDCVLGPARKSPCRRSFEIWAWRQGDVFFFFFFLHCQIIWLWLYGGLCGGLLLVHGKMKAGVRVIKLTHSR